MEIVLITLENAGSCAGVESAHWLTMNLCETDTK
jgi:hypothetical protein